MVVFHSGDSPMPPLCQELLKLSDALAGCIATWGYFYPDLTEDEQDALIRAYAVVSATLGEWYQRFPDLPRTY